MLGPPNIAGFVSVRVAPQNISKTLSSLEKVWHQFTGERPFEFTFLDEDLMTQYEAEQKTKQISGIFSAIAVFIGCLGFFGLAAFTAEKRTKEIGIRKVLGASIPKITFLLVKDFTKLIGTCFCDRDTAGLLCHARLAGEFCLLHRDEHISFFSGWIFGPCDRAINGKLSGCQGGFPGSHKQSPL